MNMIKSCLYTFACACLLLFFASAGWAEDTCGWREKTEGDPGQYPASPGWVTRLAPAASASQIVAVVGEGGSDAAVSMHEKDADGRWHEVLSTHGCIGSEGLGKAAEGDCHTPAGIFHFTDAFGINPDPGCRIPYHQVDEYDYWSCDQREGYAYNHLVSLWDYPDLDTSCSEHIIDCTGFYEYCLNISWNEEGIPGRGSAIFLHCMDPSRTDTDGCVAIPEPDMVRVMRRVRPDCVVVIDSYQVLRSERREN